jgi:FixJ family two-component response regulator
MSSSSDHDSHMPGSSLPGQPGGESKMRVLVVDDQPAVLAAIAAMLRGRGFDAVTADSGDAALTRLRAEYFDVLLCDVRMPGMSGLDILSQALLIDHELPVLMLTGANDLSTARDALSRGAMDFLTKPIDPDDLDQAVRSAAADRREHLERTRTEQHARDDAAELGSRELELQGGPLDGRRVHLHDSRLRLWVGAQADGEYVWGAGDTHAALPANSRLLGSYGLSQGDSLLMWTPSVT